MLLFALALLCSSAFAGYIIGEDHYGGKYPFPPSPKLQHYEHVKPHHNYVKLPVRSHGGHRKYYPHHNFCFKKMDGNYPIGKCKPKFISCVGGEFYLRECPHGLDYDSKRDRCDNPHEIYECGGRPSPKPKPDRYHHRNLKYDHFCKHRPNGLYAEHHERCCSEFISCGYGHGYKMHCPRGLYFDPHRQQCDFKHYIYVCGGKPQPTTRRPPTYHRPKRIPFSCKGKKSGNYPDPFTRKPYCSHRFFTCVSGYAYAFHCPSSLFFDSKRGVCDLYDHVYACSGKHYHPKHVKPIAQPTLPPVDFSCVGKKDGFYPEPKNRCSSSYFACVGGLARQLHCQRHLVYDPEAAACVRLEESYRCTGVRPTPTTAQPYRPTKLSKYNCHNKPDGLYPIKHKCSHYYYQCSNGIAYDRRCPDHLYFDCKRNRCDYFRNVFACSGKHVKPTRPPPTLPPVVLPIKCSHLRDGDYPDPLHKCSRIYYTCSNGYGHRRYCADNTFYDPELHRCDYYHNVPICCGHPRPVHHYKKPKYHEHRHKVPFDCHHRRDGNYPAGKCENHYFSCSGGEASLRKCPFSLVYCAKTDMCQFKHFVPQCGGHLKPYMHKHPEQPRYEFKQYEHEPKKHEVKFHHQYKETYKHEPEYKETYKHEPEYK
ncbi:unnamed protein product, partial [Soboliphyme baturini]|uniref:Chitin-binding type-2 domain-containing protein n=1 Tax=Soboliphyme baturini TaxID=241478 RepID=A0A183J879_9BILA